MDDAKMIEKVEKYIALYEEIKRRTNDEGAAQAILAEAAKDSRMQEIREERGCNNGDAATENQIRYLKRLGVEVTPGLSKKEASQLIDNALKPKEEKIQPEVIRIP